MTQLFFSPGETALRDSYEKSVFRVKGVSGANSLETCDAVVTADLALARQAVDMGKHALLDAELDHPLLGKLCEVERSNANDSSRLHIARPWRWQPSIRAVKDAIDAGKLGDPGLLRIHRWRSGASVNEDFAADETPGLIQDLDIAQWFFGGPPQSVYSLARDSYLQVHLGFSPGGMALLDFARIPQGESYDSLSLIGSTGAAYSDDHHNMNLRFGGGAPGALRVDQGSLEKLGQLEEFIAVIRVADRCSQEFPSASNIATLAKAISSSIDADRAINIAGDDHDLT